MTTDPLQFKNWNKLKGSPLYLSNFISVQESDYVTQLTVSPPLPCTAGALPPPTSRSWVRPGGRDDDSGSSGTGSSHSDDLTDKTWILLSEKDGQGRNHVSMTSQVRLGRHRYG